MVTAVRLRERDKRKGFNMAVYVSACSRTKYTAGQGATPSPFRIVKEHAEIDELSRFPQFEIMQFEDHSHIDAYIQQEMEDRARQGMPALRAAIIGGMPTRVEPQRVTPRRTVQEILPPQAISKPSDPMRTNTGRRPITAPVEFTEKDDEPMEHAEQANGDSAESYKSHSPEPQENFTKAELVAMAKREGIPLNAGMNKAALKAAIQRAPKR